MQTYIDDSGICPTLYHFDEDGRIVIERQQDVAPALAMNELARNECSGYSASRNMKSIAQIPMVVYEDLMKSGIADDPVRFKKWINDSENRNFRTSGGNV